MPNHQEPTSPTLDDLATVFEAAFYKTWRLDDDELVVDTGYRYYVHITEQGIVRFSAHARVRGGVDESTVYALANEFNARLYVAKCFYHGGEDRTLVFESDISTEGGMPPAQMVARLRAFEGVLLRSHPMDEIIDARPKIMRPVTEVVLEQLLVN